MEISTAGWANIAWEGLYLLFFPFRIIANVVRLRLQDVTVV